VQTASKQADIISALTALPNLEQLTWRHVRFSIQQQLSDSSLLQQMTRLTSLELQFVAAAALQHLGSLTKLQYLSISVAGCPELQDLQLPEALTSLKLLSALDDLPPSISQLRALQQLEVETATPTALDRVQVLTSLTQLCVEELAGLSPESPPLKLPGLQHLELVGRGVDITMPMSFLVGCTQLQYLRLHGFNLQGPGSLVASTMLQHLELDNCIITAADGAADSVPWQHIFPAQGQLPHLTSLKVLSNQPPLQQADIEAVVACCSNLQALRCNTLPSSFPPELAHLPGLTSLQLQCANDEECSAMVQLTGLKQLKVTDPCHVSAVGLRQLAALQQLTSLGLGWFYHSSLFILAHHLMEDNLPDYPYAIINKVCVHAESQ